MNKKEKEFLNGLDTYDTSKSEDIEKLSNDLDKSNEPLIIKMSYEDGDNYTVGVALPKNHPSSISFLKELDDFNNTGKDIYDQIDLCRKLYLYEDIVGTVVDMYIDFSVSPFKIENVNNKEAMKIINYFLEYVNKNNNNIPNGIEALNRNIAFDYYVAGNSFLYTKWSNVMMDNTKKIKLPFNIFTLDPKIIEIPKESVQFGNKIIKISFNKVFNDRNIKAKDIISNVPTKIRNKFKNSQDHVIDPYLIYHIKRKGTMYSGWGVPYLTRCFSAVASKRKLRVLDDSTIDGLINSITVFKIGDPKNEATLKPSRLKAFSSLLNKPHASMTLVWSYDIDVLEVAPNGEILKFSDRYRDLDNDIAKALGAPLSVLTGVGDRAGDVWASILFMMERFEEYRDIVKSCFEDMLEKIMIENGFNDIKPKIRYIKPKVDKTYIRDVVLALYDRGLLSKEYTLEEAGYNRDEQVKIRNDESNKIDDILTRPDVPYAPPANEIDNNKNKIGTPNPQMNQKPTDKKNSKITETNKNRKKVTPRLDGSTKENISNLIEFIIDNSEHVDEIKSTILNLSNLNVFGKNFDIATALNIKLSNIDELVSYLSQINTNSKEEFKEISLAKINSMEI